MLDPTKLNGAKDETECKDNLAHKLSLHPTRHTHSRYKISHLRRRP
jgi:hypothetical protein